MVVIVLLLLLK